MMQRRNVLAAAGALLVTACASTPDPGKAAATRREIDTQVDGALGDLFTNVPGARAVFSAAQGVLVFPQVFTAGFVIGGSHGNGALRKGNSTLGYYSLNSGSVGLLAGAQTRTLYIFFMTPAALAKFENSDGWTAGGDASVVVLDAGAMGRLDQGNRPEVLGMVRNQEGFMANLSLDGTKISRLAV
jgi:lipid-binding SYLF domain-containing protein